MTINVEGAESPEPITIEKDVLVDFVSELAKTNRRYAEWWFDFNKLLFFGTEKSELSMDHGKHCDLCHFLANVRDSEIKDSISFKRLCEQHGRVHEKATDLLRRQKDDILTVVDYDRMKNIVMKHMYNMDQVKHLSFFSIANTDDLTGMLSREVMESSLKEQDDRARRTGHSFFVALADLDHFKKINDTYGHQAGDIVLENIARIFDDSLRPYDDAFRYGGEEFLVLLPETTLNKAVNVMDRLREEVKAAVIKTGEHNITITISVGISEFSPNMNIEELVSTADENLYKAKSGGRDRVAF